MLRGCLFLLAALGAGLSPSLTVAQQYDNVYDQATGYGVDTLEARVEKLEKRLSGQALAELSNRMEKLQAEVLKLRGELERVTHELKTFKQEQQDWNTQLDQRLLQQTAAASAAAPPGAGGVPGPSEASAGSEGAAAPADSAAGSAAQSAAAPGQEPDAAAMPTTREAAYQRAFNTLRESKYPEAIKELRNFLIAYPTGEYSDNAYYWLGEAYYVTHDLGASKESYRSLVKSFPQSAKVPDALLKIGFIEYETGQYANARSILGDVVKRYPGTGAAKLAEKRLDRMRQENR